MEKEEKTLETLLTMPVSRSSILFGKIAGVSASKPLNAGNGLKHRRMSYQIPTSDRSRLDTRDVRNSLRALMWRNVGITRKEQRLVESQEIISFWQPILTRL